MVKFKAGFNETSAKSVTSINGIENFKMISNELKIAEVNLNDSAKTTEIKNKLISSGIFEYVESDANLAMDPEDMKASPAKNSFSVKADNDAANWPLKNISAININNSGNNKITVAVIDSGIDPNQPELQGKLLPMIDIWNQEEGSDNFLGSDGVINFTGKDGNGHGTHVTGIVNSVIKSANNSNIMILPIKAANSTGNTSASIITKAIIKAVDQGARVINISIGGPSSEGSQTLQDTIDFAFKKGVVIVASSGNDSMRRKELIKSVNIPSAYPNVISVAATNKNDVVSDYSNAGQEVDIAAPGGEDIATDDSQKIYSTWPTYKTSVGYSSGITGTHASLSGTSMASPYVAATAALILSKNPGLTAAQVRLRLLSSADDIESTGFDNDSGFGRLNTLKALSEDSDS